MPLNLSQPPAQAPLTGERLDIQQRVNTTWLTAFFQPLFNVAFASQQSGTTANRPISTAQFPLWVGRIYFDTTLGKPIWVKSLSPTVWVDATGAVV